MASVSRSITEAVRLHQAGDYKQAERIYREILRFEPRHGDALHLLGLLAHQRSRSDVAVKYLEQAVAVNQQAAPYLSSLGTAYRALGQHERAIESLRRAISLADAYAPAHYNLGLALASADRPVEAAEALGRAVEIDPRFADAWNALGNAYATLGWSDDAADAFRHAVDLRPASAEFHYNLANALAAAKSHAAAVDSFREAVRLRPDFAEAWNNLGSALEQIEQPAEAIECFNKAVELKPTYALAHANLGASLTANNRAPLAVFHLEQALRFDPGNPAMHFHLGAALQGAGRLDEAAEHYRVTLSREPEHVGALFRLADVCQLQSAHEDAIALYKRGLKLKPEHAIGWSGLGIVYRNSGDLPSAIRSLRQAVSLAPDHVPTRLALGGVLHSDGRNDEAETELVQVVEQDPGNLVAWNTLGSIRNHLAQTEAAAECFHRALEIDPNFAEAHANLGEMYRSIGLVDEARSHYEKAFDSRLGRRLRFQHATLLPPIYDSMDDLERWRERFLDGLAGLERDNILLDPARELVPNAFYLAYHGRDDRALFERLALRARTSHAPRIDETLAAPRSDSRIRVGFVSQHFRNHTISSFTRGFIAQLDRRRFHVTVFSNVAHADEVGQFIRATSDEYVVMSGNISTALARIVEQRPDVLFYADIGMDPLIYALAQSRLAPVQCVTWGHPITTGLSTVDYFLSSELLETDNADAHYTERLVRLRSLPTYYYRPIGREKPKSRADFGLPENGAVYLCPQSLFKFHPDFDPVLYDILDRDRDGVVVLIDGLHAQWTARLKARLERALGPHADRVRILPRQDHEDFLDLMRVCDAMLDPLHFGGGNTSYQAFALGVPIVTLPSEFMRGRVTRALYDKMGVADGIVTSLDAYVELALKLARDRDYRRHLGERIAAANSTLFNDTLAVRELEKFFTEAFERARAHSALPASTDRRSA